ncbi:hypothetical protein HHK36_012769 [Tetracentron sinense]|uniref:CWF19-like protein 2 n=1 Tax=Tetracentron sinense TaxID=13715 RepID=A0A835DEV5_TETSI|nr:hypothetical protein HHK36_012769 [Tetracentron sinense]
MFSGVKFIPRDQIYTAQQNEDIDSSTKERKNLGSMKEKHRRKKKKSRCESSDDEDMDRIKKSSKRNKKWYSSDEYASTFSSESESKSNSDHDKKKRRNRRKEKSIRDDSSVDEASHRSKKSSKRSRKHYSSEEYSSSATENEDDNGSSGRKDERWRGRRKTECYKSKERAVRKATVGENLSGDDRGCNSQDDKELARKEMGLEWMVMPANKPERKLTPTNDPPPIELQVEEQIKKPNTRELNPYLKDNGSGYPEDVDQAKSGGNQLSSSVVGDGGASWRLKALKRAQEQAAREGRKLDKVVEERWGSLGQLAVSVSSRAAAPSRAHLHAINNRKKGVAEKRETASDNRITRDNEKVSGDSREYLRNVSLRHPEMREPKIQDSLSWRKRKGQSMSTEDAGIISAAVSSLNKFTNDGSFMLENKDADGSLGSSHTNYEGNEHMESEMVSSETNNPNGNSPIPKQVLSANQLAAKALQLRMKGKHEEAEKLLKEAENIKVKQDTEDKLVRQEAEGSASRYVMRDLSLQQKKKEENADLHLVQKIVQNKQYSLSGQVDNEYDEDGPSRKRNQKRRGVHEHKLNEKNNISNRILTQQERCQFCFENPTRPRHLVVSIANFTYLMLPQWQPVVTGHCCILPMQHESATRTVDNNVWDEIRNFKKCLIQMFAKQGKDVVFLETVMGLAQQRRHCLVECIPLPREIAKQAPLYFKKVQDNGLQLYTALTYLGVFDMPITIISCKATQAIDEAEDEWSQHNAKKLIDTSVKGLHGSIPKDFPYFHVEFGLNNGFVHVIDDEKQFKSSIGLNVIRGMLRLPEEDMYRRRKQEPVETQKQLVLNFVRDWEPFDWTKQLG